MHPAQELPCTCIHILQRLSPLAVLVCKPCRMPVSVTIKPIILGNSSRSCARNPKIYTRVAQERRPCSSSHEQTFMASLLNSQLTIGNDHELFESSKLPA
eukprot:931785-Pelagomonas_calceolata.AAC.9